MGKNLDTDNIFGSYMNSVLLKEYVKPTESNEPSAPLTPEERAFADSAKTQGKNWTDTQAKLMFARQNDVKSQAGTVPNIVKSGNPVTNTQGTIAPYTMPQSSASPISNQPAPNAVKTSTVPTPNTSSIRPATGVSIADTEDWGEPIETTTQIIPNVTQTTSIAAGDDEFEQNDEEENDGDEGWSEEDITVERIPNATQTTSIAAGDDANFHPYQKKIQKIAEKRNISKFLRHLSEKNYSSAHKYLKEVLNSKINNIVAERINKNFN